MASSGCSWFGSLGYATIVLLVRLSGKRTLAKLNAFDLVVTVALGSTLSSLLLSSDVSFVEGAAGLALLVVLQLVVAWLSVRVPLIRRGGPGGADVLVHDGRLLDDALRQERVTEAEVNQAIRSSGYGGADQIEAVVLETDGSLSVVSRSNAGTGSVLDKVRRPEGPGSWSGWT